MYSVLSVCLCAISVRNQGLSKTNYYPENDKLLVQVTFKMAEYD